MNSEEKPMLAPVVDDLIAFLRRKQPEEEALLEQTHTPPFFLSQLSDQAGIVYEKIRNAVDNKEEHFLRRFAIRRIAKHILWFSDDGEVITGRLLRELYQGGYLPKNRLSRHTEEEVGRTVASFLILSRELSTQVSTSEFLQLRRHLLDLFAGALEDQLYSTENEEAAARMLARLAQESIDIRGFDDTPQDSRDLLMYIVAWRALFAADNALLFYKLWRYEHPDWEHAEPASLVEWAKAFPSFLKKSERLLDHSLGKRLFPRFRNYAIATTVLYELMKRYGPGLETLLANKENFETQVREVIIQKYREDISRASRRAWHAIVYILATKAMLAFVVESVYLSVWKAQLNYIAVLTNILFHPFLLFGLTIGLMAPPKQNTTRLVALIGEIAYGSKLSRATVAPLHRGLMWDVALAAYLIVLVLTFVGITRALLYFDFHAVDIAFFLLFLTLVLYFGFRIRYGARRMELTGGKEGFLRSLLELLALPIVSVGRLLVTKFERLNVIAVFMDFVIELPLKLILKFFDSFSLVLKEKKDEIYS
jgi:hypothetical protein